MNPLQLFRAAWGWGIERAGLAGWPRQGASHSPASSSGVGPHSCPEGSSHPAHATQFSLSIICFLHKEPLAKSGI